MDQELTFVKRELATNTFWLQSYGTIRKSFTSCQTSFLSRQSTQGKWQLTRPIRLQGAARWEVQSPSQHMSCSRAALCTQLPASPVCFFSRIKARERMQQVSLRMLPPCSSCHKGRCRWRRSTEQRWWWKGACCWRKPESFLWPPQPFSSSPSLCLGHRHREAFCGHSI